MEDKNKLIVFQDAKNSKNSGVPKISLCVFEHKKIRRIWHNDEQQFSVVDVVAILTDSPTPRKYWGKVKDREFNEIELSPIWVQLKLEAPDGKLRETDCAHTKAKAKFARSYD